jgi:mono/diheme cytochrome c family protein
MRFTIWSSVAVAALAFALVACKKPPPPEDEPATTGAGATPTPAPAAGGAGAQDQAKQIYATRCTPCHGAGGHGDGAASANLTPKPRNFGDPAWQQSIDDAYIEKIIKYGGAAVGKSPAMPGNPDLSDAAVVAELRTIVRSFNN